MTTKKFSQDRMGRNPFASKPTPRPAAASAKPPESGIFQKLMIEFPIHLVFIGLKSFSVLRAVVRSVVQTA